MSELPHFGFDDTGQRVPIVWPVDIDPEERGAALAAIDGIRRVLQLVILGHKDAAASRAAALGCLVGLYATPAQAAKAAGVSRSTVFRAMAKLKCEFNATQPPKSAHW